MTNNFENSTKNNDNIDSKQKNKNNNFMLLLLFLFLFFNNSEIFSQQLKYLNSYLSILKNYLNTADATLQALDQASQIPKQILK